MAHCINGIITSFKYKGDLPHIILVGNYHFIPFTNRYDKSYKTEVIKPYQEFTSKIKKTIKELSFIGACVYLETDYFGGTGTQLAEVWKDGAKILGPLLSYDGLKPNIQDITIVDAAINEALQTIGIYKQEGKDEFASVGLDQYRSNDSIIREFEK